MFTTHRYLGNAWKSLGIVLMKSPAIFTLPEKKNSKRAKCSICRKKLKAFEGKLCSCSAFLCIRHRYKEDHLCKEGLTQKSMEKIVPKKIEVI